MSSEEEATDRETGSSQEPPSRQNLQAALQLLRQQPQRGTDSRGGGGEEEEENDTPHHGAATQPQGVFDVDQSVDLASQDIDFNFSPPEGVLPRSSLAPTTSLTETTPTASYTITTPLRPRPLTESAARRQNDEASTSSGADIEAMVSHHRELLTQYEQQERLARYQAQEQARHAEELRRIAPRVPRDPASATDTNSDGEPPIAAQLRRKYEEQVSSAHVVPRPPHPLVKTIRAPSMDDRRLPLITSSDSSLSDPYPDPTDRRYKPKGEQKVPKTKRANLGEQEGPLPQQLVEPLTLQIEGPSSQQLEGPSSRQLEGPSSRQLERSSSQQEQETEMETTLLVVEDQQQGMMLPPLVRSLRTQSSDENSHSSSSSDHSGVVTVVTTSTCLTTTSAEVGHHHGDSRNRNQDSSETGNQDSSGTGNQDSSGNGNQDTSTQAGADEISMEYIGDIGSLSLLSDSSESVLAIDSLSLPCSSRSHVTLSATPTISTVSSSPLIGPGRSRQQQLVRGQTAPISPLVSSAREGSHSEGGNEGQDVGGGQKRLRDESDTTNGVLSSVAGTNSKKQRTQDSSEETIILSTTHSSSSFSSTSDSTDKQQSLSSSSSSSAPHSGDSFKIPSSSPLKSSQISRCSSSAEETANCSKTDSGGSSGYSAGSSQSRSSPSPASSNSVPPLHSPVSLSGQSLLSGNSQPVSNNDIDTLPTPSFSGDNIITSTPEDAMEGCDPGSCDSHVTSKGETSTVTTTSGSFDNTETSSGGSHGDGSRGGGENGGNMSHEDHNDEQNSDNKRYDKGTSEGGDNLGDNKDGGLQEDTAKDSSSQEVELDTYIKVVDEKEVDKTVCPQSPAAVKSPPLWESKTGEREQGRENELEEEAQSPVLLPSQDTDYRPPDNTPAIPHRTAVSPAPSTANSSQVCSSFVLHLSPSQSTQHDNSTRAEDVMEVDTEPSPQSGSKAAQSENASPIPLSRAGPLCDYVTVQDTTVGVTATTPTLIQTHPISIPSSSHQLQMFSQLSGTPFHFQLPCEGLLQPQLTLPPPTFSQADLPTNAHRRNSCPPELVEEDKETRDVGIECLFTNEPGNEGQQQEAVTTPTSLFAKVTTPTSRKSLSLRRHKSAGDHSSMSALQQRVGGASEQEVESMQTESVIVEEASEQNAEFVRGANDQESESVLANEQETEPLRAETESLIVREENGQEPVIVEEANEQETEPLVMGETEREHSIVREANRQKELVIVEQANEQETESLEGAETECLIVKKANRQEPVIVEEANEQETEPLIVGEASEQETESVEEANKQILEPVIMEEENEQATEPLVMGGANRQEPVVIANEQESVPMIVEVTNRQESESVLANEHVTEPKVVGEASEQETESMEGASKQILEPVIMEEENEQATEPLVMGGASRQESANEQASEPMIVTNEQETESGRAKERASEPVRPPCVRPTSSGAFVLGHVRREEENEQREEEEEHYILPSGTLENLDSEGFSALEFHLHRPKGTRTNPQSCSDQRGQNLPASIFAHTRPTPASSDMGMRTHRKRARINCNVESMEFDPFRYTSESPPPPVSVPRSIPIDRDRMRSVSASEQIDSVRSESASERIDPMLTATDAHNDGESERCVTSDEQASQDDSFCTVTLEPSLSSQSTLTTPNSLAHTTSLPPPSQMSSSSIHNLSLPALLSSPSCADHPSAPYIRVTEVAFRVIKEVENKIVEKSTGRVLDQYSEQVSDRPFKREVQFEHLNEVPPSPSTSIMSDSSIHRPSTPLPGCFASPSSSVSNHTPLPRHTSETPLPLSSPIPTLYQQQQHNLPLTSSLPLHSSSPHSSLSSSPCSSKSTTSIRGRRVRLQKRARQREDTTGQAESPASLPPPSPSLSVPRVGEKVLASWRRDNKWYVATIEKITETRAHISYLDGDHGQLQLSSLLPLEILKDGIMVTALCTDNNPQVGGVLVSCDNQQQFTLRDQDGQVISCSLSRLCLSSDTIGMLRVAVLGNKISESTAKGRKRKRISLAKRNAEQLSHNQATLFKGKVFLLTQSHKEEKDSSFSDVVDRDEVCKLLCDRGGFVMDEFNEDQVLLSSTFCLSDQWCRTIKYLTAVAVGLPCLEYDWVKECIRQGHIVDYKDYLLPVGNSQELGRIVQWSPERQQQSCRYLKGLHIFLCGQREFKECWKGLLEKQGASVIARQPSQLNHGVKTIVVMESATATPSASLLNLQAACGVPIVAKEWVVQCLVNHKHIRNYDHYKVTSTT